MLWEQDYNLIYIDQIKKMQFNTPNMWAGFLDIKYHILKLVVLSLHFL